MPTDTEHVFTRTSPEQQGIASSAILAFLDAVEREGQELHSLMLLKGGCVVAEGWWSPYGRDIPHVMFSLSKSFTSTAVGLAVDEGYFSIDDPVIAFFPDDLPDHVSEYLAAMRVRHLLSMSTGHDTRPFPWMYEREDGNWARGFFETPLQYPPGTHFFYNTGASYMLSEIVQRTTGKTLMEYLTPRLFEPLGIKNAVWAESPHGVNLGGIGLSLKTEDIARFGQLYLQKGVWRGRRILSEDWVREATSAHIANGDDPNSDWAQGYGYQFWRCQHGLYRGDGAFGQFCIVMDDYDAVLAMTSAAQDMQKVMNAAWDYLLPGIKGEISTDDGSAYAALVDRLSSLHYPPREGRTTSPKEARVSGKPYLADANEWGVESLSLDFSDSACTLRVKTAQGEEIITAGHGEWLQGQSSLFDELWLEEAEPLVASGAWLNDDRYAMSVRLYQTPYVYTLTFQFDADVLTLTLQINVSLHATEPRVITARQHSA